MKYNLAFKHRIFGYIWDQMDFSHIHGRYSEEENLPWDFKTVINKYLKNNMKLLNIETGGGEFLLSLNHPKHNTSAIEGYQPNVELCKKVFNDKMDWKGGKNYESYK